MTFFVCFGPVFWILHPSTSSCTPCAMLRSCSLPCRYRCSCGLTVAQTMHRRLPDIYKHTLLGFSAAVRDVGRLIKHHGSPYIVNDVDADGQHPGRDWASGSACDRAKSCDRAKLCERMVGANAILIPGPPERWFHTTEVELNPKRILDVFVGDRSSTTFTSATPGPAAHVTTTDTAHSNAQAPQYQQQSKRI